MVGDTHARVHRADLGDKRPGGRFCACFLNADEMGKAGKARIGGSAVILQHDGQKHGIGKAVGRAVQPAERVRDGVHVADARAREGRACVERRLQHGRAVGEGSAVAVRALKVGKDGHNGALGLLTGLAGVVKAAQIRLYRVRQRVHAGFRRDVRRQPRGKRGVEDRVARDKAEVGDRIFAVVASGDDGGDGRFRSRAGGGGDGDERWDAAANLQKSRERGKAPVRPDKKRRGGLGRVHRRAAADDEEAVAAVDAVLFGDFFDRFDRGVRLNGGKDGEQNILHI